MPLLIKLTFLWIYRQLLLSFMKIGVQSEISIIFWNLHELPPYIWILFLMCRDENFIRRNSTFSANTSPWKIPPPTDACNYSPLPSHLDYLALERALRIKVLPCLWRTQGKWASYSAHIPLDRPYICLTTELSKQNSPTNWHTMPVAFFRHVAVVV